MLKNIQKRLSHPFHGSNWGHNVSGLREDSFSGIILLDASNLVLKVIYNVLCIF